MDKNKKHLNELKESLLETLSEMEDIRRPTEAVRWEACAYVKHRSKGFNLGQSKIKDIKNHTIHAVRATNITVEGIMGYLLSQNVRWFNFTTQGKRFERSDQIYGAKDYLEQVVTAILDMFAQTNFYSTTGLAIRDVFVQGTSAEFIIDDEKRNKVYYDTIDPQEFYIAEDETRKVDTFFRVYEIPVRKAYKRWGDKLPSEVKRMFRNGAGHQRIKFLHAIYPREDAISDKGKAIISTSKPFASVHYSYVGDEVFDESGYDEFPIAVHRWNLNGSSPYGSSPVIEYLEEIRKLDRLESLNITATDKQINPPIFAPPSMKGRLNLDPGGKNYMELGQNQIPQLFQTSLSIDMVMAQIEKIAGFINSALHADLFTMLMRNDNKDRTATEIREMKGEGLILLSAIIGNMQEEKIAPLIMRTYHIMERNGLLPPPPAELVKVSKNGQVKVVLDGPLAQNMKAYHQSTGIVQGAQMLGVIQQYFPNAMVNVDEDEFARQALSSHNMPETVIREQADVKKIKARQQAVLEEQARVENMKSQAEALSKMPQNGTLPQQMAMGQVGGL